LIVRGGFSTLRAGMGKWLLGIVAGWLLAASNGFAAAETNAAPAGEALSLQRDLAALQEQQQATLRAVEQARQDAEAAARRNAEALEARLQQLEDQLQRQRAREVESLQNAHHYTLTIVAAVAGLAVLALLGVAWMLLRSMNRRGALAAPVRLQADSAGLAPLDPAQQSSARFRASLDRLEQRLDELESTALEEQAEASPARPAPDLSGRVALLLGKGQALLNLHQPEAALACFDEALELDPAHAEAFVKRGTALEKLGRFDEAIECYDRAIGLDTTMTMAYLCKGGVFNRLERYGEALKCYEQALHAHQKSGAA
jgi:tetratricopeptide (TPR) repeat protein